MSATTSQQGVVIADGLEQQITPLFRPYISDAGGMDAKSLVSLLDADSEPVVVPHEVRRPLP